jgi:hypothetical protein
LLKAVQARSLHEQTLALKSARGSAAVASATMRDTVIFYQRFLARPAFLSSFLIPLSNALEAHPEITLRRIAWQAAEGGAPMLATIESTGKPPLSNPGGLARESGVRALTEPTAFGPRSPHQALVEAEVLRPGLDVRGAQAAAERLVAAIDALPNFDARLVRPPLDMSPTARLEARLDNAPGVVGFAFAIAISHTPFRAQEAHVANARKPGP